MPASAKLKSSIQAFIKTSGGSGDLINNKCLKLIAKSSKLVDKVKQNDLDTEFSAVMGKLKSKNELKKPNHLTIDQFADIFVPAIAGKYPKAGSAESILGSIENASPELSGVTKQSKTGNVDHFTDTSKYTGSHKERFDESGKGKGIEGREEKVDNTGYVGAYKGDKTYDKTH